MQGGGICNNGTWHGAISDGFHFDKAMEGNCEILAACNVRGSGLAVFS
jgi:hypothetical protein